MAETLPRSNLLTLQDEVLHGKRFLLAFRQRLRIPIWIDSTMPFTPFHMGPGILVKGPQQGGFSLITFGLAQVLIDLEPLYVIATGKDFLGVPGHLHGISHTLLGATLVGLIAGLLGRPLTHLGLRILGQSQFIPVPWRVIWWSAFFGTYSHLALDAVMHRDVEPFAPWNRWNPLVGLVSVGTLHLFCMATAALGAVIYLGLQFRRKVSVGP